jgi:acyl-ACP thioesterase
MNENIFSIDFRSASYDVGANAQISLTSILRYFQEAAFEHANNLDVGYYRLQKENIFWVLSAMWVETGILPGFDEQITVTTWPRGIYKLYSLRDFLLYHKGKEIAKATSLWLMADLKSKRIIRPERFMENIIFPKNKVFNNDFSPIEPLIQTKLIEERRVRYSDLDINSHVNNIRYVEWIFDAIADTSPEKTISALKIQYLGEFLENEKILIYSEQTGNPNEIKIEINHKDEKTGIRALLMIND